MSRKNTLQYQIAKAQSLASSFTTPPTFVRNGDNLSFQINITTSDSIGTFALQVSDDYRINDLSGVVEVSGNWIPLTLSGVPFANAANDNINISMNQLPAGAIRVSYTPGTAGTGTCDIFLTTKQVGG